VTALSQAYDRLLVGLAAAAAAGFGLLSFIIAYEVVTRWLGFRPPVWPVAISEYTLLYATVLAAPWVLRRAEHVQVTTLVVLLPERVRPVLGRIICLLGAVVCFVVAWYALRVTLTAQGLEIRSFEMPKWIVYAPLPLGFLLLAVEFLRHMRRGTLFTGEEFKYLTERRAG
jgi:TRAP-type C4-dicarboxylate transport system permease small subunit